MLDGRDLLDEPLIVGTESPDRIEVTFTDRRNLLSGSLETAGAAPAPDYFIVVIPADRRAWQTGSRRFAFTRPASDGAFALRNLPAGDYLLAALTDFEPADFGDDRFIAQLVSMALPITIRDGEQTVQAIRLRP